ncbi:hypothetical protein JKG61_18265 [Sphingobacterium sp. C459-1T]|uniref:Substrate import-associated zinc metallohydrolase lipoprotein n=2 Tax=Sphingobacterium faecale TaxID=2803775 RepID=A0ABS1R8U0_9SPHI|nr:hypothetical protein [Sphingobacterium faecale]
MILQVLLFLGCSRDNDTVDVDMSIYSESDLTNSALDKWLLTNLVDPYNIEVVYRFDRNNTEVSRDVSPVKLERVQPMMEAVLNCYIRPYEKIAGKTFIKTFVPKQYALFGSVLYNTNGSVVLGTADAGRKVTLYDVNNFSESVVEGDAGVRRKLRTIHHEFVHIMNQNVIIPPSFAEITKADYYEDWTNSSNTETLAKSLGFVSRYARGKYTEDFAEMAAHLLVMGQVWFDNYVLTAPRSAQLKLRAKEQEVVDYYKAAFGLDFRALQNETQLAFKTIYNAKDPTDITQTLPIWLGTNKVKSILYTPGASHYTSYGISTAFTTVYNNFVNAVATQSTVTERRFVKNMALNFSSDSTVTVSFGYASTATGAIGFYADYDFGFKINVATSEIVFTKKVPEGTTGSNNNGALSRFKPYFEQYILPYMTNRVFVLNWLPTAITPTDPLYRTFGGFYEKDNSTNYFYGPIELK